MRYSPELREKLLNLIAEGSNPKELAREFGPSSSVMRYWVSQEKVNRGLTAAELGELETLRRKVARLKVLLRKAKNAIPRAR